MALLHELHRRGHVLRHVQPRHHDAESAPREAGDTDFALHVAEFDRAGEDAHIVEFFQEQFFVFKADRIGGGEGGEGVG